MDFVDVVCANVIQNINKEMAQLRLIRNEVVVDNEKANNKPSKNKKKKTEMNEVQKIIQNWIHSENRKKKKKNPLIAYPKQAEFIYYNLSETEEVVLELLQSSKDEESTNKSNRCCLDLEKLHPRYKVYTSGSRALGLSDEFGDCDVFLDVGNTYHGNYRYSQPMLVKQIARELKKRKNVWGSVCSVPEARTPIVKALHIPSRLFCDISFRSGLGHLNTSFIRTMMQYLSVMKPLILILKYWCKVVKMDQTFRSYYLTNMLLFYLQIQNFLPSLAKMRSLHKGKPIYIAGWEVHFSSQPSVFANLPSAPSFLELLHGFYDYYGRIFKFEADVICPLLGHTILKTDFDYGGDKLPCEMQVYKEMINHYFEEEVIGEEDDLPMIEFFRNKSPICVQDPFDLSHNLTKAVSFKALASFRWYCSIEADKLDKIIASEDVESHHDFWVNLV